MSKEPPPERGASKVTFLISAEAKYKLAQMKNDLRFEGMPATEKAIVEKLIVAADIKSVARLLSGSGPRDGRDRRRGA